jgi:hypothetical protein
MLTELVRAGGCAETFDIHLAGKVHFRPEVHFGEPHASRHQA